MIPWNLLGNIILIVGWSILVGGTIYIIVRLAKFSKDLKLSPIGRLAKFSFAGWLVTMHSLGVTATGFILYDASVAVPLVLPVFIIWLVTMVGILSIVNRLSREVVVMNDFFLRLDDLTNKQRLEEMKQKKD